MYKSKIVKSGGLIMFLEGVNFSDNNIPSTSQNHSAPGDQTMRELQDTDFQQALERASAIIEAEKEASNKANSEVSADNSEGEKEDQEAKENKELMAAARQFESLFIQQMLQGMRDTVPESDLIDGGLAEEIYEGMLDQEYAEKMAESGNMGLADKIYEQFTSEQAGLSYEDRAY